jgi:hypothetical protein
VPQLIKFVHFSSPSVRVRSRDSFIRRGEWRAEKSLRAINACFKRAVADASYPRYRVTE